MLKGTTKDTKDTKKECANKRGGRNMAKYEPIPKEAERWGKALLDAAFEVHTTLGAGFLERVYEDALCYELALRRVPFERQKAVVVSYKDFQIGGQRLDLLIGGLVIAEIKAVDDIHPIHQAQLMSYLKATGLRLGFVINFNVPHLKEGIRHIVL
jgi:GxxExxY protein